MFKIVNNRTFTHDVAVMVPVNGGHQEDTLKTTFNYVDADKLAGFDLTTGEFLTLDGLDAQPSTDSALGESLTHTLAMAVLEQIDAQGLSEYYFEDYASYIFDLAANASFYFNDKGMTIVFDPCNTPIRPR